jgi:hypothetical protein
MLAQITRLQHWKSEHTAETCQDRLKDDPAQGLFAVADGAGTTSFPRLWAGILAAHFVEVPLLNTDPFEVEWWVRLAQEKYEQARPPLTRLDYMAREKEIRTGSESTLVTLRLTEVGATQVQGVLLAFGDSCALLLRPGQEEVETFPLKRAADFERAPICVPSNAGVFHRHFHKCGLEPVRMETGSTLILATDAVARWMMSAGNGEYTTVREACEVVASRRPGEEWGAFIEDCRRKKAIVDDDCTAVVIRFQEDEATREEWSGLPEEELVQLGVREQAHEAVLEARRVVFEAAQEEKDWEMMAVSWGDGVDLAELQQQGRVTPEEIEHARKVADALKEVIATSAAYYKKPEFVSKMREVWGKHQDLLGSEPRAAAIKKTLEDNGVFRETPGQAFPQSSLAMMAARREEERFAVAGPPSLSAVGEALSPTVVASLPPTVVAPPTVPAPEDGKLAPSPEAGEQPRDVQTLRAQLDNALRLGNEADIVALDEQLRAQGSAPTDPQDVARVERARRRVQVLEEFRVMLERGDTPGAVVDALNKVREVGCASHVTASEQQQVRLAARFLSAFHAQADEELVGADVERQRSAHPHFLRFTRGQEDRLALAWSRQRALDAFRAVAQGGQPRQIVEAYRRVLDVGPMRSMQPEEQGIGDLVEQMTAALAGRKDEALAAAFDAYQQSSCWGQLAFTGEELERMRRAQERVGRALDPTTVLVRVRLKKGTAEITAGRLKQAQAVKRLYLEYDLGGLQQRAASAPPEQRARLQQRIQEHQAQLASPEVMEEDTLEELVDDVLIQQGIALEQADGVTSEWFQLPWLQEAQAAIVGTPGEVRYRAFLRDYRLTDDEVGALLSVFLRRRRFQHYLRTKPAPEEWGRWIERRRKKAKIDYFLGSGSG